MFRSSHSIIIRMLSLYRIRPRYSFTICYAFQKSWWCVLKNKSCVEMVFISKRRLGFIERVGEMSLCGRWGRTETCRGNDVNVHLLVEVKCTVVRCTVWTVPQCWYAFPRCVLSCRLKCCFNVSVGYRVHRWARSSCWLHASNYTCVRSIRNTYWVSISLYCSQQRWKQKPDLNLCTAVDGRLPFGRVSCQL
jgi:hypothetical protein